MASHPILYELNTRSWLRELSEKYAEPITLGSVPEAEIAEWRRLNFTHIWLMGVWATGDRARQHAVSAQRTSPAYKEVLPDLADEDIGSSPYAIADYRVAAEIGGEAGLQTFRQRINAHGLKLVLDFVPNHLGLDHRWIQEHPHLFVQGAQANAEVKPGTFRREIGGKRIVFAYGKDPYFPAWSDTVQLDFRSAETQGKMLEVLADIAQRCDGVRCDMAMLVLDEVFARTWADFPALESRDLPEDEFWLRAIGLVKPAHPDFCFLAEAYWGLEARLQELGFDFTYDKELYDRLIAKDSAGVSRHVRNTTANSIARSAHFLENHDERRIASLLPMAEHRAAALITLGLPGMRFLHHGQLMGATRRVPVQLTRHPKEPKNEEIERFYNQLLTALPKSCVGRGEFEILTPQAAWAENPTAEDFVVVQWWDDRGNLDLVVVNYAGQQSQCYVRLTKLKPNENSWNIQDLLSAEQFVRTDAELREKGFYLDVQPFGAHVFRFSIANG